MATRKRADWKVDNQGQFARQIGWKLSGTGKRTQHKFRLGSHRREAERREGRLLLLWDTIERRISDFEFDGALWTKLTLSWGKQIAKGTYPPRVDSDPNETSREYAKRVLTLRQAYTGFPLEPADVNTFEIGLELIRQSPSAVGLYIQSPSPELRAKPTECPHVVEKTPASNSIPSSDWLGPDEATLVQRHATSVVDASSGDAGERLHNGLRAYQQHLRVEYSRPVEENGTEVSDWGHTQISQVDSLLSHHEDQPLRELDVAGVDSLIGYWRRRPLKLSSDQPIARDTAGNHISLLVRFFTWLHRNADFDWFKPSDFHEISTKVATLQSDRSGGLQQVKTFSINQLATLIEYGTPLERALFLLALNCGFGAREIATLRWDEIFLHTAHEPHLQELLGHETTDDDSFIKRNRGKSGVYGEWLLFQPTVKAIDWLRQRHASFGVDAEPLACLNDRGLPYFRRTKSGNFSSQIPNRFAANRNRAINDGHPIPTHSFGKLRKTAGDLVRRTAGGEVAAVFLTHAQAVRQDNLADVYTNRPFGSLFETLRELGKKLEPVFEAAGPEPFVDSVQSYTKKSVRDQIEQLHQDGITVATIADQTKVSVMTVYRHLERVGLR